MADYSLPDEPRPGALAHLTVQPIWPLFAMMFAGSGVSWIWFVFNGIAMGSPTRKREVGLAALGFAGAFGILLILGVTVREEWVSDRALIYLREFRLFWKLGISYWLYTVQARTFGIYEYFGGPVRNGMIGVVAAYFVWRRLVLPWLDSTAPWLLMILD